MKLRNVILSGTFTRTGDFSLTISGNMKNSAEFESFDKQQMEKFITAAVFNATTDIEIYIPTESNVLYPYSKDPNNEPDEF